MKLQTHLAIDTDLCGRVTRLEKDFAEVTLSTRHIMQADEKGLVHGGFLFGAADYAAMAAINDPNVVLGAANVRFVAPVRKGETVVFCARVTARKGKKHIVNVRAETQDREVFAGEFTAFVLERHVLEG